MNKVKVFCEERHGFVCSNGEVIRVTPKEIDLDLPEYADVAKAIGKVFHLVKVKQVEAPKVTAPVINFTQPVTPVVTVTEEKPIAPPLENIISFTQPAAPQEKEAEVATPAPKKNKK